MQDWFYLKLRSNIALEGDVKLAEREMWSFFKQVKRVNTFSDVEPFVSLPQNCVVQNTRSGFPIGFVTRELRESLPQLVRQLNFTQEIWTIVESESSLTVDPAPWWTLRQSGAASALCMVPLMAAAELLSYSEVARPSSNDLEELTHFLSAGEFGSHTGFTKAIRRSSTSTPHVHSLHKYKAKFFPRMIRSLLVAELRTLPCTKSGELLLLDPFVGSGTALVEASTLGLESLGIDIDVLSCLISVAKLDLLDIEPEALRRSIAQVEMESGPLFQGSGEQNPYVFPPWMARKFERWNSLKEQREYENEITRWLSALSRVERNKSYQVLQICLSDAITRKFNVRMMGTGVGRFALEIGNKKLARLVKSNLDALPRIAAVVKALELGYGIEYAPSGVLHGIATAIPLPDESVSVILTSPPYLPASSGRENYLIGKSISVTALGLMTAKAIRGAEKLSVGSMRSTEETDLESLPAEVRALTNWLKSDPLREIKAAPTLRYYADLKRALEESYRVLLPGGVAIYVIGKESVFYRFSTREVLYRVACDDIFQRVAESCGFSVKERLDVQLDKKSANARPRSLDIYFETVFKLVKEK